MTTQPVPPRSERVRLFGWVDTWHEAKGPVRALLFGEMVQRAIPVTRHYFSDLYHDVEWIAENVNGPTEFHYMARQHGTNIGPSALTQERISSTEPHVLYLIALTVERGEWFADFTELHRVERPAAAEGSAVTEGQRP